MQVVLARSGTCPCPIDGVAFVAHSQIQMLGVPLGCDEFVAGFVDKKLKTLSTSLLTLRTHRLLRTYFA